MDLKEIEFLLKIDQNVFELLPEDVWQRMNNFSENLSDQKTALESKMSEKYSAVLEDFN